MTPESGPPLRAITDAREQFVIRTQPGRYRLNVARAGFVRDNALAGDPGYLTLTPNQRLDSLRLLLQLTATLRGMITTKNGEPKLNAEVVIVPCSHPIFQIWRPHKSISAPRIVLESLINDEHSRAL